MVSAWRIVPKHKIVIMSIGHKDDNVKIVLENDDENDEMDEDQIAAIDGLY